MCVAALPIQILNPHVSLDYHRNSTHRSSNAPSYGILNPLFLSGARQYAEATLATQSDLIKYGSVRLARRIVEPNNDLEVWLLRR